uniref:Murine leukemia virus integrase C-terminal domain-containing protein n=1 Tax=Amazona collaria TaxID=241587 RepID=A0A8B9G8V8_9PSIT
SLFSQIPLLQLKHRPRFDIKSSPLKPCKQGTNSIFIVRHPLSEKWKGPYETLLMTYATVKARGITPWLHYSKIKKAPTPEKSTVTCKAELIGPTSVCLRQ